MHRREVLKLLAANAGIACLEGLALDDILTFGRYLHARGRSAAGAESLRVLGPRRAAIVTIAAERIIPASDTPGATDAAVTTFIDQMLADWYDPNERDRLLGGLAELDARSRTLRGRDFVGLSEPDQVALLSAIDGEVDAMRRGSGAGSANEHWFAMLKFLTVWGYFTSEAAMRQTLGSFPLPWRYDGCAPYPPPAGRR